VFGHHKTESLLTAEPIEHWHVGVVGTSGPPEGNLQALTLSTKSWELQFPKNDGYAHRPIEVVTVR